MRITWIKPEDLIEHELRQCTEAGQDVTALASQWQEGLAVEPEPSRLRPLAERLLGALEALPPSPLAEWEPSDLESIQAQSNLPPDGAPRFARAELQDRLLGAWQGRAAGCLLGKPVEKIPRHGIRAILEATGRWPLDRWFTAVGLPEEVAERYPWNRASRPTSLEENITCMPEDDDLNYPMLNLHVLESFGRAFTTDNVGETWLKMLPALTLFTAERVAYLNMLHLIEPPRTATTRNPYREWIGAQIRGDLFGWVNPGRPSQAAEMAWRDARLSHVANGIYGELFVAAMSAAAFTAQMPLQAIETGLAALPARSRLAEAIRFTIALHGRERSWEGAVDQLYERYGRYHWVHTINNAALVVAALLYGEGDYERSICYAVMGGWDTDCNGATVGAVLGAMQGASGLPSKWIAPLRNQVRSSLKGFDRISFDELASRTLALVAPDAVEG